MKWDRAKNLIIIFLVLLNVALLVLNTVADNKYEMTPEQENNIIRALTNNNIAVYVQLPTNYKPMQTLQMTPSKSDIEKEKIAQVFIDNPSYSTEFGKYIASSEDGKRILTFENGFFNLFVDSNDEFVIEDINKLTDIVKQFGKGFENYKLDIVFKENDRYMAEYREMVDDTVIYSNYVEFEVVNDKLVSVRGYYSNNSGYSNVKREISSVDMALFTFMQEVRNMYPAKEIFVNKVDIVYYQEEYFDYSDELVVTNAVPCYRIYIEGGSVPFIISAYTNKIINY